MKVPPWAEAPQGALDKDKLVKVLRLTTSPVDGEALAAVRMANTILLRNGLDWDDLVAFISRPKPEPQSQASRERHNERDDELEKMFDTVLESTKPGTFRTMLEDIYDQWTAQHWITPRQREVIENAYNRRRT